MADRCVGCLAYPMNTLRAHGIATASARFGLMQMCAKDE